MMLIAQTDFPLFLPQRDAHKQQHNYAPPLPLPNHGDNIAHLALKSQLTFMATVAFPSPSAILRSPVQQPAPAPEVLVKTTQKKRPAANKAYKGPKEKLSNTTKPKQTKSRDGKSSGSQTVLSWLVTASGATADFRIRLQELQREAAQMRRGQTSMRAMS